MKSIEAVKGELEKYKNAEKAEFLPRYFKVTPGGYGEGDQFIGVTVPLQRKAARKYFKDVTLDEIELLLLLWIFTASKLSQRYQVVND